MKKVIFISLIVILSSCIREIDRYLDAKHVEPKKISEFPENANVVVDWSVYNNSSVFKIKIDRNSIIPEKIDTSEIPVYKIKIVFFDDKGAVRLNRGFSSYTNNQEINKNGFLILEKTLNYLNQKITADFSFPMYLFHNVSSGSNNMYMGIALTQIRTDGKSELYKGFFKIRVDVPEIYCSRLICNGLELQCDSIWSPYNSDFSFGKGLPDVYWAICIPSKDSNDVENYYASTPVIWNSYGYDSTDTIDIFTYKDDEELLIGVYDYDRVFSDEYIGSWHGKLSDLYENKTDSISFYHVSSFKYEMKKPFVINAQKK